VHVAGVGSGSCAEDKAHAAMASYNDHWIEEKVDTGAGSCSVGSFPVSLTFGSPFSTNVSAKLCW
jgi:hypothetical protein